VTKVYNDDADADEGIKCQTPSIKTQTDKYTNGQTPGIEFVAF